MAENKNKKDKLHSNLPKLYNTKENPNWKAILGAIGENDQQVANLIEDVRKQLFVATASRPYLDKLASNNSVVRPRFVGMDDETFRRYVPIISYKPRQVKLIIDQLLDIFFFKESTTAYAQSTAYAPFALSNDWKLEYTVDIEKKESIIFKNENFVNILAATCDEVVSAINRQAKNSFAVTYDDSITKRKYIRVFSNTVGAKGSVQIDGGLGDIGLRFTGFNEDAGNGITTQWTVSKVGDLMKFQHTAGDPPGISFLDVGHAIIIDLPGNKGSFVIDRVDVSNDAIFFKNILGTAGVYTQISPNQVKFRNITKSVVYTNDRRAVVWEVSPGQFVVEMPSSPPVVKRKLAGSAHINGLISLMTNRISSTSLELEDASAWPNSGTISLEQVQQLKLHIKTITEDFIDSKNIKTRLDGFDEKYTYTGKSGNTLTGISPALPALAAINEFTITTANRNAVHEVTVNTTSSHNFNVDDYISIQGSVGAINVNPAINLTDTINGAWKVIQVISPTSFKVFNPGDEGLSTGGTAKFENIGFSNAGTKVILRTAQLDTGITGPYIWDTRAAFVLSHITAPLISSIEAGGTARIINVGPNSIPNGEGSLIFDYGTERQEGPVRFLYKPSSNTVFIDPSYVFKYPHGPIYSSSITMLRSQGAHKMSGLGKELAAYVTDTAPARITLQELIKQVKSAGVFVEFLIRYPEQVYATLDVYQSGIDPG